MICLVLYLGKMASVDSVGVGLGAGILAALFSALSLKPYNLVSLCKTSVSVNEVCALALKRVSGILADFCLSL